MAGGQQQPGDLGVDAAILVAHHEGVHGDGPRAPQQPHESKAQRPSVVAAPTPAVPPSSRAAPPGPLSADPGLPRHRPSGERHPDAAPTAGAPPTTVIPRGARGRSAGRCGWSSVQGPPQGGRCSAGVPVAWGAGVVASRREVRWRDRAK